MSKAVTSYLIAMILVAIVIIVVGYLIFTYYSGFSNTGKYTECTAKKLRFCFEWGQNEYGAQPGGSWDKFAPGCTATGVKVTDKIDC